MGAIAPILPLYTISLGPLYHKNPPSRIKNHKRKAIHKSGRGFKLGTSVNKPSKWSERALNPGMPDFESDALTTWPHCALFIITTKHFNVQINLFIGVFLNKCHDIPGNGHQHGFYLRLKITAKNEYNTIINTIQYSTIQYSTIQYHTIRYIIQ